MLANSAMVLMALFAGDPVSAARAQDRQDAVCETGIEALLVQQSAKFNIGVASGAAAGEVFKANLHDLEAIEGGLGDCGCLAARVLIDRPLTVFRGAEWRKDKRYADEVLKAYYDLRTALGSARRLLSICASATVAPSGPDSNAGAEATLSFTKPGAPCFPLQTGLRRSHNSQTFVA